MSEFGEQFQMLWVRELGMSVHGLTFSLSFSVFQRFLTVSE